MTAKGDATSSAVGGEETATLLKQLCSAIVAARGPILDRVERAVGKFSGSGEDVATWLDNLERRCGLESVSPGEIIEYLLDGSAVRVYRQMTVAEASQWEVVKARLMVEYGLPRHEAYRQFKARQLQPGEAVDVYADDLQRLAARLELRSDTMVFKAQFYDGLPARDFEWAVTRPDAFTASFTTTLGMVRERMSAQKSVAKRRRDGSHQGNAVVAGAATKEGDPQGCFRCGGTHMVRNCKESRAARSRSRGRPSAKKSAVRKQVGACFKCGKFGHFARNCSVAVAVAAEKADFQEGGESGGNPPPVMETD